MKKLTPIFLIVTMLISFQTSAFAVGSAGFENSTFSARQIAHSGAGSANPVEPASISYNPAGLTELPGVQFQSNAGFLSLITHYENKDVDNFRSTGTIIPSPTAYLSINPGKSLGDKVAFGVGMDAPFGLVAKYPSQHQATRFAGYDTWLKMYAIKPVIAVKLHEKLSIGAGPMYYRVMDFGTALQYPTLGAATGSNARLTTRGQAWGWHLGVLAKPHEKHNLGFYFRSPVTMHLGGRMNVEGSVVGGRFESAARTKMDLPLNFTWSYAYKATEKTTLMADLGYTRWSAFKRLYVVVEPVNATDDAVINAVRQQDKDWRSSFSVQLGADHKVTEKLTLMAGTNFYTRAVPDSTFIPGVADSNRLGFSLGANYAMTKNLDLGLGYLVMLFLSNSVGNDLLGNETPGTSSVDGKYFSVLNDFVLSMTYKWDPFSHEEKPMQEANYRGPQGEDAEKKFLGLF